MRHACICPCHNPAQGDYRAARQHERWFAMLDAKQAPSLNAVNAVEVTDVVAAALACDACRANHCEALLEKRVWWDEPIVTPLPVSLANAVYEDGEGRED